MVVLHRFYCIANSQGRRRDFESGPAERSSEGTTGGRAREGGLPKKIFEILMAFMCILMLFLMRLGKDFSRFGHEFSS